MDDVNEYFHSFAAAFAGRLDHPDGNEIAFPDVLDRGALDLSLESLQRVDDYLLYLHEHRPERLDQPWVCSVLWCGAYVGEVIRGAAPRRYDWVDYEPFVAAYPDTVNIVGARDLSVTAFLTPGGGGFTLPINKVRKFLGNGPEDSVWFYAAAECRER